MKASRYSLPNIKVSLGCRIWSFGQLLGVVTSFSYVMQDSGMRDCETFIHTNTGRRFSESALLSGFITIGRRHSVAPVRVFDRP